MFEEDAEYFDHRRQLVAAELEGPIFPHRDIRADGSVVDNDWVAGVPCSLCGQDIDHGRRRAGAVSCASCSVHTVLHGSHH